ncbi:MAG: YkuS family protein [Acetobacteraceae bacterium]|nr:YkuS family protein [Acetobacteraceae bacterium]
MARVVAVEDGLGPLARALSEAGYKVVGIDRSGLREAELVLVSGQDQDLMGSEDVLTRAPVLCVAGQDPEAVLGEVERRLGPGGA